MPFDPSSGTIRDAVDQFVADNCANLETAAEERASAIKAMALAAKLQVLDSMNA
jgi:hypothetical protein